MSSDSRTLTRTYGPAVLLAAVLVIPIFIDTISHPELSTGMALAACAAACVASLLKREPLVRFDPLTAALLGLVAVLAVRSAFAPEPGVAFFGAYGIDATVWTFACVAFTLLASRWWHASFTEAAQAQALTAILAVVALYSAASGWAGWAWNSTDGMGGPPSGFTANSQYQLQLMLIGLACTFAWAWRTRGNKAMTAIALFAAGWSFVGAWLCRASSSFAGLVVALGVGAVLVLAARGRSMRLAPAAGTAAVAALGFGSLALLTLPSTAPRTIQLLNALGGSRGSLWASAAHVLATNLPFGRGLGHATSVTRWTLGGDSLGFSTTVDPHNLFITIGIGGGVVALAAGLAVLYFLQRSLLASARIIDRDQLATRVLVVSGAAAVFAVSMFAFVYPVAWMLCAALLGLSGALHADAETSASAKTTAPRAGYTATVAIALAIAALLVAAPPAMSSRLQSLHVALRSREVDPITLLGMQLDLVRRSADVMPANAAVDVLNYGLRTNGEAAREFVPQMLERLALVRDNMRWDARLAAAELELWASSAPHVTPDIDALTAITSAGIAADPGSAMWASAGAHLAERHGFHTQAIEYARSLAARPELLAQLRASADSSTTALIERLAIE